MGSVGAGGGVGGSWVGGMVCRMAFKGRGGWRILPLRKCDLRETVEELRIVTGEWSGREKFALKKKSPAPPFFRRSSVMWGLPLCLQAKVRPSPFPPPSFHPLWKRPVRIPPSLLRLPSSLRRRPVPRGRCSLSPPPPSDETSHLGGRRGGY